MVIAENHANRKTKLQLLMKNESKAFITGVQKAYLADDGPLAVESKRYMGRYGNRDNRFKFLHQWLEKEPLGHRKGYNYGWSSLAASEDGCAVVALDNLGKHRWYKITKNKSFPDYLHDIPASRLKFEEYQQSANDQKSTISNYNGDIPEGIEIVKGVGSTDTFQMFLLKLRNGVEIRKASFQGETMAMHEKTVSNFRLDKTALLDACVVSTGIYGAYDTFVTVDEKGKILMHNFESKSDASSKSIVGNLENQSMAGKDSFIWASLKAPSTGNSLHGATRKSVHLFDIRSRPQYNSSSTKLFTILSDRSNEASHEMIGGITHDTEGSGEVIYFCTNVRIMAVDKRMPGRVYTQMLLHSTPSFSKKVALPSGIASASYNSMIDDNSSKLNYLTAWWPYSSASQANCPAAIVGCFDQSYNYCPCQIRSGAVQSLGLNFEESCVNGDHSRISSAPMVVRGLPLRIAGPLSCIDYSNQQTANRISLPLTGFTMTTLLNQKEKSSLGPISILSANIVGDIFLTELSRDPEQTSKEFRDDLLQSYHWKRPKSNNSVKQINEMNNTEKLREDWIKSWWIQECTDSNDPIGSSKSENQIRLSHLKKATVINRLKPFAHFNSISTKDDTKLERQPEVVKRKYMKKEDKIRARALLKKDSLGRPNGMLNRVFYGPKKRIGRAKGSSRLTGFKAEQVDQVDANAVQTEEIESCRHLKIIQPLHYTGPQGVRSADQLAENKFDSKLRFKRKTYYN